MSDLGREAPAGGACFRLTLEYDGTEFEGWQVQARGRTVQGELEAALRPFSTEAPSVVGAGRTDAGVHAEGQVASVELATDLDPETLRRALNARLPHDVAVVQMARAPEGFHARYHARAKLYRYQLWNAPEPSPLRARRTHHVPQPLDLAAVAGAAAQLEGTHDFASFQAAGSEVKTTVRTLFRAAVGGVPGGEVRIELHGDGFLRHMVRNVAGTLVEVGLGRRSPASLAALLRARDRSQAGPTAPARGLTLVRVDYAGPEPSGPPGGEGDSPAIPGP